MNASLLLPHQSCRPLSHVHARTHARSDLLVGCSLALEPPLGLSHRSHAPRLTELTHTQSRTLHNALARTDIPRALQGRHHPRRIRAAHPGLHQASARTERCLIAYRIPIQCMTNSSTTGLPPIYPPIKPAPVWGLFPNGCDDTSDGLSVSPLHPPTHPHYE